MYWWHFFGVMAAVAIADAFWTLYFIATEKREAWMASIMSSLIILSSAYATTSYVDDKRFIIAAVIGAFIGTFLTITYKKRKGQ
jgi:hypothetical protein